MWGRKKEIEEPKVTPVVVPKETTRIAVMEIVVINNKTDKEQSIKSINDFGLSWQYVGDKGEEYKVLCINQYLSLNHNHWRAVARFFDFSILHVITKDFDIIES